MNFDLSLLEKLTGPGPRLPWIKKWLIEEIWSPSHYKSLSAIEYLKRGEDTVNKFEILIASSADRVYGELLSMTDPTKRLLNVLSDLKTAVVVFDGLSLRELPIVSRFAEQSGFTVSELDCSQAAIPSETADFIERELTSGRIGPSQLPVREELKNRGISVHYFPYQTQSLSHSVDENSLLVWSAFPDNTYKDSGARFDHHFEHIHMQFETAWMNTVQQIKNKKRIIITSDHGYIFFGTGMDFPRASTEMEEMNKYFGNDRYAFLAEGQKPPQTDDIILDANRQVALVKGRVRTRSTGEAAARLYKHGGLSLMEMLTPWVVLTPK